MELKFGEVVLWQDLLDLDFLIGNSISVELCRDVLCLSHPWDHLGVLLRPKIQADV